MVRATGMSSMFGTASILAVLTGMASLDAQVDLENDSGPPPDGTFTIVLLPDSQDHTTDESRHDLFRQQAQWIADQPESHGIEYVLHVGDVVNNNTSEQWDVARSAFDILSDASVPFAIAPGNHDYGPGGRVGNRDSAFNDVN